MVANSWKIEIKNFQIDVDAGLFSSDGEHLYLEFWNDRGERIAQLNGLATNKSTGEISPFGFSNSHYIKAYNHYDGYFDKGANFFTAQQRGVVAFEGTEAQVRAALAAAEKAGGWIDAQQLNYDGLSNGGTTAYNSNATFSAFIKAINTSGITIAPAKVQAAQNLHDTFFEEPGIDDDMLRTNAWNQGSNKIWYVNDKGEIIKLNLMSSGIINLDNTLVLNEDNAQITGFGTTANGDLFITKKTEDGWIIKDIGHLSNGKFTTITRISTHEGSEATTTLTYTQFDANNKPIGQPDIDLTFKSQVYQGEVLGDIFGSQLGALVAGDNVFAQVAGATVGATLVGNIAEYGQSLLAELGCWILSKIHYNRGLRFVVEAVY